MHHVMGDELPEILGLYLADTSKGLAQLGVAVAAGDCAQVDEIAHRCAGTSATCGVDAVVPSLRALEKAGLSSSSPSYRQDIRTRT